MFEGFVGVLFILGGIEGFVNSIQRVSTNICVASICWGIALIVLSVARNYQSATALSSSQQD